MHVNVSSTFCMKVYKRQEQENHLHVAYCDWSWHVGLCLEDQRVGPYCFLTTSLYPDMCLSVYQQTVRKLTKCCWGGGGWGSAQGLLASQSIKDDAS